MSEEKGTEDDISFVWILIGGTLKSPDAIKASDKKRYHNGTLKDCIISDLQNMKKYVEYEDEVWKHCETLHDPESLKCEVVLNTIKTWAMKIKPEGEIKIYYTGNGETNTGNWCFMDGVISFKQLIDTIRSVKNKENTSFTGSIFIFCDCSYSGNWCKNLGQYESKQDDEEPEEIPNDDIKIEEEDKEEEKDDGYRQIFILTSTCPDELTWDTQNGGLFTQHIAAKNDEDKRKIEQLANPVPDAQDDDEKAEPKLLPKFSRCYGEINYAGIYQMEFLDKIEDMDIASKPEPAIQTPIISASPTSPLAIASPSDFPDTNNDKQ